MENRRRKEAACRYGVVVAGVLSVVGCASIPGWTPMEDVTPRRIARKEAVAADFERKYASIAILEAERLYRAGRYDQAEEKLAVALRQSPDDSRVLALARKLADLSESEMHRGEASLSGGLVDQPDAKDMTLDEPLPGEVVITSYEEAQPTAGKEAVRTDAAHSSKAARPHDTSRSIDSSDSQLRIGTLRELPENVRLADRERLVALVKGERAASFEVRGAEGDDRLSSETGLAKHDDESDSYLEQRNVIEPTVEGERQTVKLPDAEMESWRLTREDRELLAAACEALQAGERQEGVLLLCELAARSSNPVETACRAALTAMEIGCPEAAVQVLSSDTVPQNHSLRFYQTRALALWRAGRLAQAKRDLDVAISLDKHNPLSYFLLGCVQAELGQQREAEANYRLAASLEPRFARYRLP
ncbi:hypothetical protein JCM19992_18570 [Thermostilla marina]